MKVSNIHPVIESMDKDAQVAMDASELMVYDKTSKSYIPTIRMYWRFELVDYKPLRRLVIEI